VRSDIRSRTNLNDEEIASYERRLRRRRLITLDENGESDEETGERVVEFIDFRTYPLTICWKDIYSFKSDSCKGIC
jgi:hypothetical protein